MRPQDIPVVAQVISHALLTDPNSIALWGGKSESHRQRIAKAVCIINLEPPVSETVVAWMGGRIVGALGMLPWPHCQLSWWQCLFLAPKMIGVVRGALFRAMRLQAIMVQYDPPKPHWHLGPVGVLPEMQGQGIGGKLIRSILQILDGRHAAAYLETDRPGVVSSHQRLGFSIVKELDILGVHNYLMWRDPIED